jgi:hypothetical protein
MTMPGWAGGSFLADPLRVCSVPQKSYTKDLREVVQLVVVQWGSTVANFQFAPFFTCLKFHSKAAGAVAR